MEIINSEQNQWIKKLRLLQQKKYREESGLFVIEGLRFCEEAITNQEDIVVLLVSDKLLNNNSIKNLLKKYKNKPLIVADEVLAKQLKTVNPQGIAAIVHKPQFDKEKVLEGEVILVIDGVQDPGNLGTIFRTALAAGVSGVFCLKGTVDVFNDKTLRSTMGAIFNLPIFIEDEPLPFLKELKKEGFQIIMADPKGEKFYHQFEYPKKSALVLGSESRGPINIIEADYRVKIPLNPLSESLNVAVAGGIILYEINRQRDPHQ
ncbi:MAG: RNA methyltransferase [Clostridia bacterium]|jgi:TrmH family RNA methyltransferase|nr:RNA methyltransferase [Clostridia bacterium]